MSTAAIIDLAFIAVVFAAVLYWIFVAPARARKKRHLEMYGQTGHFQAWDPNIGARKRER
jgi:preprotein translocase subunit YajC